MKKMISLKSILSNKEILTASDIAHVKGGAGSTSGSTTNTNVVSDDKRRPRPGGGASTQYSSTYQNSQTNQNTQG